MWGRQHEIYVIRYDMLDPSWVTQTKKVTSIKCGTSFTIFVTEFVNASVLNIEQIDLEISIYQTNIFQFIIGA